MKRPVILWWDSTVEFEDLKPHIKRIVAPCTRCGKECNPCLGCGKCDPCEWGTTNREPTKCQ